MYETPPIIAEIGILLRQPMSFELEFLETQIIELEALRVPLAEAVVDSMKLLHDKRKQMLWPKDAEKKLTELDRNIFLSADVSVIERDYELLRRLETIVEERLALELTILKTRL